MTTLIIYITGKPLLHGYKRREFHWSPQHGRYLFEGRAFGPSEFNDAWARAYRRNADMNPQVMVWEVANEEAVAAPKSRAGDLLMPPRKPTLDEALAIVKAEAPDKLKKPAGRPPKTQVMEVA